MPHSESPLPLSSFSYHLANREIETLRMVSKKHQENARRLRQQLEVSAKEIYRLQHAVRGNVMPIRMRTGDTCGLVGHVAGGHLVCDLSAHKGRIHRTSNAVWWYHEEGALDPVSGMFNAHEVAISFYTANKLVQLTHVDGKLVGTFHSADFDEPVLQYIEHDALRHKIQSHPTAKPTTDTAESL